MEGARYGAFFWDRGNDSGVQIHVAFPFMHPSDLSHRKEVLALMVFFDDFVFFKDWQSAMKDNCNNIWTNQDVSLLAENINDHNKMQEWVTLGSSKSPFPSTKMIIMHKATFGFSYLISFSVRNLIFFSFVMQSDPRVKHKHFGFRGKDTYHVDYRFGIEVRRSGKSYFNFEKIC